MINSAIFAKELMSKILLWFVFKRKVFYSLITLIRENERKIKEQASHLKWLEERELKQQELKKVQQLLLRSPSKTSNQVMEVAETEIAANSPSVTDQLNIDVSSEEGRETASAEVKTTTGRSVTPVIPSTTTPSSPLLTSLLRSPTASSAGPPGSGTKVSSSPVATKLNFNLSKFL